MPLLITGTVILVIVILISAWLIKYKYGTQPKAQVKRKNSELSNFVFNRKFSLTKPKVNKQAITANPIFIDETDAALKRKNSARGSGYFFRGVRMKKKSYEIHNGDSNKWKGISRRKEIGSSNPLIDSEAGTSKSKGAVIMRDLTENEQQNASHDLDHDHTEENAPELKEALHYESKKVNRVSGIIPHGLKWAAGKRGSSITLPRSDYPVDPKQKISDDYAVNMKKANASGHDNMDLDIKAEVSDDDTITI